MGAGAIVLDSSGMKITGAAEIIFTEALMDTLNFKYGAKYGSIDFVNGVFSVRAVDDDLFLMVPSGKALYIGFTYSGWNAKITEAGIIILDGTSGRVQFGTDATEIWLDASGNLTFKDAVAGTKTLAELAV